MYASREHAVQPPWLSIVGMDEQGWDTLSTDARAAIHAAEFVIGGDRHLALLPDIPNQARWCWPSPLLDAMDTIKAQRGRPVCVLASGDPFWYGIGATLARYIDPAEMRVWPQPAAFSLAAARLGWALQHVNCLSACGRDPDTLTRRLADRARLLILSSDGQTPAAIAERLTQRGFGRSRLTVLEHMGGANEKRLCAQANQWPHSETAALNLIAVECIADAPGASCAAVPGRPSAGFSQDGQITRAEVRAIVLSALAPGRDERLWDIGAGSGAIGVEWMLADPANHAIAVEARDDRIGHIRDNARRFGVPGLECVHGRAPEALEELAPPDAIFIGGGLTTPGLLEQCRNALQANPRGRIVATSVTVEGDAVLADASQRHGGELRRIQVSRGEPLGGYTGWSSDRPITIWHCWNREHGQP